MQAECKQLSELSDSLCSCICVNTIISNKSQSWSVFSTSEPTGEADNFLF